MPYPQGLAPVQICKQYYIFDNKSEHDVRPFPRFELRFPCNFPFFAHSPPQISETIPILIRYVKIIPRVPHTVLPYTVSVVNTFSVQYLLPLFLSKNTFFQQFRILYYRKCKEHDTIQYRTRYHVYLYPKC